MVLSTAIYHQSFVYTHFNYILVIQFLNDLELSCRDTSIASVSIQLNGFNYCYLTQIIIFSINQLFTHN